MKKITVYTDGACSGNPGPGGWGAVLLYEGHKKELSGGEKARLLFAAMTYNAPQLLILDEPLQGLDSYARAMVRSFISYFMHHGDTSILFVSHHAEDAPEGITNKLTFVPVGDNNYEIVQEKVKD